jgi:hypothetical protein
MQDIELMVRLALFADDLLRGASRVGPPLASQRPKLTASGRSRDLGPRV